MLYILYVSFNVTNTEMLNHTPTETKHNESENRHKKNALFSLFHDKKREQVEHSRARVVISGEKTKTKSENKEKIIPHHARRRGRSSSKSLEEIRRPGKQQQAEIERRNAVASRRRGRRHAATHRRPEETWTQRNRILARFIVANIWKAV